MSHRVSHIALGAAVIVTPFGAWTSDALAQTYSVTSITPSGSAPTLVAGTTATATITLSPSGSLSSSPANNNIMHSPNLSYLVSVKCVKGAGANRHCTDHNMVAVISDSATVLSTSRLGALLNFTIGSNTQSIVSGPSGSNPTTFTLSPLTATITGSNSTYTGSFQLGFSIPVLTTGNTGVATSRTFSLGVGLTTTALNATPGSLSATVWNAMSIHPTSNMSFGQVTAPPAGGSASTYTLTPGGSLSASGGGATFAATTHSAAAFNVTGEGGQAFSLTVPASFNMTTGSKTLTVTTSTSYGGTSTLTTQSFAGALGTLGSFPFSVGGTLLVAVGTSSGTYTGNLIVTVQYN